MSEPALGGWRRGLRRAAAVLVLGVGGAFALARVVPNRWYRPPPANALRIDVYGHRWWWEFRYPEYQVVTANELYLPAGRAVAFSLHSDSALTGFSIPRLAGPHELRAHSASPLWLVPDPQDRDPIWTGVCTRDCGAAHALPRFLMYTVAKRDFVRWAAAQHAYGASILASAPPPNSYVFPRNRIPAATLPQRPIPTPLTVAPYPVGSAARGEMLFAGAGTCVTCHMVRAKPLSTDLGYPPSCLACHTPGALVLKTGIPAPDLTHIASRAVIASGMYPNDAEHLKAWLKNARLVKPGTLMPTFGAGQYDPQRRAHIVSGLSDQQIADLVAYLQVLK